MTSPAQALPAVLDKIDADLDHSLERLFDFLRIQSISTDPAYKDQCQPRPSTSPATCPHRIQHQHPPDGRSSDRGGQGGGCLRQDPARAVLRSLRRAAVDPLDLWEAPPFAPRIATLPDGRKIIVARGACDDKGQVMTFVEACRAFKAVTGALAAAHHMMIEGEEECGSNHLFGFVKDNADELKLDLALVCDTSIGTARRRW